MSDTLQINVPLYVYYSLCIEPTLMYISVKTAYLIYQAIYIYVVATNMPLKYYI